MCIETEEIGKTKAQSDEGIWGPSSRTQCNFPLCPLLQPHLFSTSIQRTLPKVLAT
jgi:hypothetical protein